MVEDAEAVFKWLRNKIHPNTKIIIWGHEIGSAVGLRVGTNLTEEKSTEKSIGTNGAKQLIIEKSGRSFSSYVIINLSPCSIFKWMKV